MENIRQALERARTLNIGDAQKRDFALVDLPAMAKHPEVVGDAAIDRGRPEVSQQVALDAGHLEANRIVGHDDRDFRSKAFDMLRTQVLQAMDQKNWKVLGITSPSPGCGKTVTAINLALSMARRPERSVLLLELDLQKPQVANYLGLRCRTGLLSVLDGRSTLQSAIVEVLVSSYRLKVLPAEGSTPDSSAWITSSAMNTTLQTIKRDFHSHTVIVDLPPMLSSDDALAVLPQLDCMLLVAGVGKSTMAELEDCNKHLQSAQVIRMVLNQVPGLNTKYHSRHKV